MGYQFNPITGNLDLVGSGGGGGNPFNQSLNTTDDVAFNSINTIGASLGTDLNVNGSASFASGGLIAVDDGEAKFFIATDGSAWGAVGLRGTDGFVQASSGTMRIEGSGGSLAAIEANSASFANGAATIGADGQFSFQSGAYYSSTDGTGNFLTYQNDSYYQLQFLTSSGTSAPYWNIGAYFPTGMFQIASSVAGLSFAIYDGSANGGDAHIDCSLPVQIQGGRLTSDGTNLYWNGTQIA